jgi:4-oxalocrotonate tautomerase
MATITVRLIEGMLTAAQKRRLASRLTDAVVRLEGEAMRPLVHCIIEEVGDGAWSVGGQPVTLDELVAISRGSLARPCVPAGAARRPARARTRA